MKHKQLGLAVENNWRHDEFASSVLVESSPSWVLLYLFQLEDNWTLSYICMREDPICSWY